MSEEISVYHKLYDRVMEIVKEVAETEKTIRYQSIAREIPGIEAKVGENLTNQEVYAIMYGLLLKVNELEKKLENQNNY